jgi:HSP20 family molecular chaperone IbpA
MYDFLKSKLNEFLTSSYKESPRYHFKESGRYQKMSNPHLSLFGSSTFPRNTNLFRNATDNCPFFSNSRGSNFSGPSLQECPVFNGSYECPYKKCPVFNGSYKCQYKKCPWLRKNHKKCPFEKFFSQKKGNEFPQLNKYETSTTYVYQYDLPGCNPNDISLKVGDNTVTVSGERRNKYASCTPLDNLFPPKDSETFSRTDSFPCHLSSKSEEPYANYENGVLTVEFAKNNASSSNSSNERRIPVNWKNCWQKPCRTSEEEAGAPTTPFEEKN